MTHTWEVSTPTGVARIHQHPVDHGRPRATLVLGHGVGGGVESADLAAIAAALPADGVEVVLVEQPWRVAGRKLGGPPPTLDAAWVAALADLRGRGVGGRRLVAGGRSSGARVACRTAGTVQPAALLLLAFPLHPLRRGVQPPPSRMPELVAAAAMAPTVVVQGTRDTMGRADQVAVALAEGGATARVVPIPWADHSFRVPASAPVPPGQALDLVVRAARATALRIVSGDY